MKTPVLETRRKVMTTVANAYPGGRDCAAARLGLHLRDVRGVFVRTPEAGDLDNVDLHHRSLRTAVKRGRVDQMIALALEDGEISADEAKEILALHAKHMAARHEEVRAVLELHRAK